MKAFTTILASLILLAGSISAEPVMDRLVIEGYENPGLGRHVVLVAGDDEYRSEETMPMLAKILAKHHGFKCTVLFSQEKEHPGIVNPNVLDNIPGLEELRTADLLIIKTRFRTLPDDQMQEIDNYLRSGRPVIGLRTANHGFRFPKDSKWAHYGFRYDGEKEDWKNGFGGKVLGSWFFSHHGWHGKESTRGIKVKPHSILEGISDGGVWGTSDVYGVKEPIQGDDVEILLRGQVLAGMNMDDPPVGPGPYDHRGVQKYLSEGSNDKNDPMQALAWTMSYQLEGGKRGRVFSTTLGSSEDFIAEGSRRMVVNAAYWALGLRISPTADVSFVDEYNPSRFKNYKSVEHWRDQAIRISDLAPEHPVANDPKAAQGEPLKPYFDVTEGRGEALAYHEHPVNRHRLYDFYARQAEYYLGQEEVPEILPGYPGLDAGTFGHWGAFSKNGYADRRWEIMDIGHVFANIFRHKETKAEKVRGITIRLSPDRNVLFDTETLSYTHLWEGKLGNFSAGRWGIGKGIEPGGDVLQTNLTPEAKKNQDFRYHGYYLSEEGVTFHYEIDGVVYYDTPGLDENGQFLRQLSETPPPHVNSGAPARFDEKVITLTGEAGSQLPGSPFAIDRIPVPLQNEFGSVMLIGGHDFFSNGDAAVCTMFGDVWRVSGLDASLQEVRWHRIATGLNQALGVYVERGETDELYVVGRDRISRLHDLNGDREIDYYENFNDTFRPNPGGHSFHTGLQRDAAGNFYFVAAEDGLVQVSPDGSTSKVIATGLRNANGVGADPNGALVTTSNNEGDWTPTSAVYEVVEGDFYGRKAKKDGAPIAPPLAYIPRGLDNSSGGQVFCHSESWGPLQDKLFHFSFGAGTWMMVLRDEQEGKRTQGAVVPLPGDFESGTHRGRFHPLDGQLYVSGSDGWGNYAVTDGDFARIRYTGANNNLPISFQAYRNGILLEFASALDPASLVADQFFAQMWNYQHMAAYGSLEWSIKNPQAPGHDPIPVDSVNLIDDSGKRIFVEMRDLLPAMQMHLYGKLKAADGSNVTLDIYPTLISLRDDFTGFDDYAASSAEKETDLTLRIKWPTAFTPKVPQQHEGRGINVTAIAGLLYQQKKLTVKAGEDLSIRVMNRDSIPHNWVLGDIGSLETIGAASNVMMTNPEADKLHYVPEMSEVLHFTPMLERNESYTLHIKAPEKPGTYPYLCTFPGHWMIMKGEMIVE